MEQFEITKFAAGEIIIKEGDNPDYLYLIISGEVEIVKRTQFGEEVVLDKLGKDQLIGEMGLIDNKPRSASVIAVTDVELKIISKEDFIQAFKRTPFVIQQVLILLISRLRFTSTMLALFKSEATKRYDDHEARKNGEKIS